MAKVFIFEYYFSLSLSVSFHRWSSFIHSFIHLFIHSFINHQCCIRSVTDNVVKQQARVYQCVRKSRSSSQHWCSAFGRFWVQLRVRKRIYEVFIYIVSLVLPYRRMTALSPWCSSFFFEELVTIQETPHILRSPKFHYRIQKSPLPFPVLTELTSAHALLSYSLSNSF
jgi:hypothetical protein